MTCMINWKKYFLLSICRKIVNTNSQHVQNLISYAECINILFAEKIYYVNWLWQCLYNFHFSHIMSVWTYQHLINIEWPTPMSISHLNLPLAFMFSDLGRQEILYWLALTAIKSNACNKGLFSGDNLI